jgi:hypothetical protein
MVKLNRHVIGKFKKYGVQIFEVFQLGSTEDMMDFVNISKTVSVDQDDEVWMEMQSYRDRKHLEEMDAKMMNDKNMAAEGQQFLNSSHRDLAASLGNSVA